MNQLAKLNKHLREASEAYQAIKTEGTREKANVALRSFWGEVMPSVAVVGDVIVPSVYGGETGGVGGETVTMGGPVGEPESVGVVTTDHPCTCNPLDNPPVPCPHKYALGECRNAVVPPAPEKPVEEKETAPVEVVEKVGEIGGWPMEAGITMMGLAPNRRMWRGRIRWKGEIRGVCVERIIGFDGKGVCMGRLVRAGSAPLYRPTEF